MKYEKNFIFFEKNANFYQSIIFYHTIKTGT